MRVTDRSPFGKKYFAKKKKIVFFYQNNVRQYNWTILLAIIPQCSAPKIRTFQKHKLKTICDLLLAATISYPVTLNLVISKMKVVPLINHRVA